MLFIMSHHRTHWYVKYHLLLTAKMLFETWACQNACHWDVCEIHHFMWFLNVQWLLFLSWVWFRLGGGGHLSPILKEDRDDSKYKVTICMLVKRTIEYCDWIAVVTSGHMLLDLSQQLDFHHLLNVLIIICLTPKLPATIAKFLFDTPNIQVFFSPATKFTRGLNCLSWMAWFYSNDRQYSYTNLAFSLSVSLERWELGASCCTFSEPVVLNSLFVIRASTMGQ